jgi:hypothetical protein
MMGFSGWEATMEMMDIGTATKVFDGHTQLLVAKKALLIDLRERAKTDSELAELAKAETEQFLAFVRQTRIFSILFCRRACKQATILILHPGPMAELIHAQTRFDARQSEITKFCEELRKDEVYSSAQGESSARSAAPDRAEL